MSKNSFEIIMPDIYETFVEHTEFSVTVSQTESTLQDSQSSGMDLGWGGAVAVIAAGYLVLKAIHGPGSRNS